MSGHFLIVEARFYADIADAQLAGAKSALSAAGASFEHVSVPGALEIPVAIAMAARHWRLMGSRTQAEARGVFMQHVQRRWSAAFCTAANRR